MNYNKINVRNYLYTFNQILNQMEKEMLSANIENNITIDFIRCMIPHHQAAIYMCENLLRYTYYRPLQEIAKDIIKTQTNGIQEMKEIAKTTIGFGSLPRDTMCYIEEYKKITNNMICKMRNSPRCYRINLDFINEMIPHHEGAVEMCNNLLKYYIDPRLKCVAENIIKEQSAGIKELEQIRNSLVDRGK